MEQWACDHTFLSANEERGRGDPVRAEKGNEGERKAGTRRAQQTLDHTLDARQPRQSR